MGLQPLKSFRDTSNSLYTLIDGENKFLVKCYRGGGGEKRRNRERFALNYWKAAGFLVPQVHDREVPGLSGPYLVTALLEGPSLRELLLTDVRSPEEKRETLARLFAEMARRLDAALSANDALSVHHDPNTGNIICAEDGFYFVDFEAPPRKTRRVQQASSIEIATTARWIVRDLGIEFLHETVKLLAGAFASREALLKRIVKRTAGRPFQFYHRRRNRKYKKAHPDDVTKYDIADALSKLL